MKKFTLIFLALFFSTKIYSQMPPPPQLQPNERWTNLWSVSYDYQTNGSVRYIVQDPANPSQLCAILMAQQDSNSAVGAQRYIYYSYSSDDGNNWTSASVDVSASWGFPDLSLSSGQPIVTAHKFNVISNVFKDISFAGFGFELVSGQPTNVIASWPHLSGTSNGNIVMAASTNDGAAFGGYYATYNGTTWVQWTPLPQIGGPSGNYSVESGTGGVTGIFGTAYSTDGSVYYYKSNDNGITFDNGTQIFTFIIEGGDTLFANIVGGLQAVYTGGDAHLVFSAYNINTAAVFTNPNTIAYIKPKIMHWSQATGLTQVAGKFNIPNLTDTITTLLMVPVCQPSVSVSQSGLLSCTFTAFLNGNTQIVDNGDILNAGEIFISRSTNNGTSWSAPVNITNTPSIEEKHSSLVNHSSGDTAKVQYIRDMKAGGWVNNSVWGKAPVYGIYQSVPAGSVGINENNSAASYELFQNYPNPFNPKTVINYNLKISGNVKLTVYDILGNKIKTLVNEKQSSGSHSVDFNGENLASGIYYYKLEAGNFVETKSMMLVK